MSSLLPIAVLLPLAGAALAPLLLRRSPAVGAGVLALFPGAAALLLGLLVPLVETGEVVSWHRPWFAGLDVSLSLRLDGLALLMAILVGGIGAVVTAYAGAYLGNDPHRGRFFATLLAFQSAMLGIVLAGHVMTLFVAWEITSVTSYLLVGHKHADAASRAKARQALLVTGLGGLALLAGLVLITQVVGSGDIATILASGDRLRSSELYPAILALVFLGAATKSGQVPFHFWLPGAMAAPTPVSALLHSATMVKAGVYLLARFFPVLGNTSSWTLLLVTAGLATTIVGAWFGIRQKDLKAILAGTTLSKLGLMVLLLGLGTEVAVQSAVMVLIGHALYKAALFLVVGVIDHETGTREVTMLRGLRTVMPVTASIALVAALSKAGFPPFLGFLGKEFTYIAKTDLGWASPLLVGAALVANAAILALAFKVGVHPFWGKPGEAASKVSHEAPWSLLWGPLVLAVLGLVAGLFPMLPTRWLLAPAMSSVAGERIELEVALWHGFNLPLVLSITTLAAGIALYQVRSLVWSSLPPTDEPDSCERGFNRVVSGIVGAGTILGRLANREGHQGSLAVVLVGLVALAVPALAFAWSVDRPVFDLDVDPTGLVLSLVIAGGALAALRARSRLGAVFALGVSGYGVASWFAWAGAPDLALTQLCVETLCLVLVVASLPALPGETPWKPRRFGRFGTEVLAATTGLVFAMAFLHARGGFGVEAAGTELAAISYPEAHGRNVVNVILVDFRALDTLGEVVVLVLAALGAGALLRGHRPGRDAAAAASPLLSAATRVLVPVLLGLGALAVWRGHHLPGGGFIGGLVVASAVVLSRIADGRAAATSLLRFAPFSWMASGGLVALGAGLLAAFAAVPFLTGLWLPAWGPIHLGTPLLFDVGVFLAVVGSTVHHALAWAGGDSR